MKVVILAGGLGTRIAEYTNLIPKPMIEIGGRPILWHIMNIYSSYGFNDFVIALGFKSEVIKEYFLNYYSLNSDFEVDLSNGHINYLDEKINKWKVSLIDTGLHSMTGGRIKRLEKTIKKETFMVTYGDAVSNINIVELFKHHRKNKKLATITAVHPPARFGELTTDESGTVTAFKEKPQTKLGWINGGFFVFEPEIFSYIKDESTVLEKEPLETLANEKQLISFYHSDFWQSMDSVRDKNFLEEI